MQEICIVIPCYNEEKRLRGNALLDFLSRCSSACFCFVNDGSSDGTIMVLEALKNNYPDRICIVDMKKNYGKSEAVRLGMLHASEWKNFDVIGFWDADLSTPISELYGLMNSLNSNEEHRVAIGSRVKRLGAQIERSIFRHIFGRVFSTFSNWILKIPVYDSQCGAKIFKKEIIDIVFKERFITKWLFDVEILARIRNYYGINKTLDMVVEVPLFKWMDIGGSKLNFYDYIEVPMDLLKIHRYYNKNN